MEEKRLFIFRTLNLLWLIILYHIIGNNNIFPYVLSFSLYHIFIACFNHITLKETLSKLHNKQAKKKILKIMLLTIGIIGVLFLIISVLISDTISIFLKLDNILPIFIFMSLTVIIRPIIKLISEYLADINNNRTYYKIPSIYNFLDKVLILVIAIIGFRLTKLNNMTANDILYLSKPISALFSFGCMYLIRKQGKDVEYNFTSDDKINYQKEVKRIFTNNSYNSITKIVKYSYYYISVILLYLVLSTRYNFKIDELSKIITFIYFYASSIMNYLIYIAKKTTNELPKDTSVTDKLYNSFKMMLTITIIFGFISPLTCKVIFNSPEMSIYFAMANIMAIFILLFDVTYDNIKNKNVTYISLIVGIITKIVLVIPLINSFYRMGYNLIYGDIVSTCIAMFTSVIINYIYLRNQNKKKDNYFNKILDILYDNIILAIILVILEVIIPRNTDNYFIALGLIVVYMTISIAYIYVKNKIKNKK